MKEILAIDDNESMRKIIINVLEKANFKVTTENDGEAAYIWMIENRKIPDLIICDIEMKGWDGYKFLEVIRNSGFFGDIPVIMLSGVEETKERIKCYNLKAQDFLKKPFNPKELIALIEKNLDPKIRLRNFELNENDKYQYFKLGALQILDEVDLNFDDADKKIKEKLAELQKSKLI